MDTVDRLLQRIPPELLEETLIGRVRALLRRGKLQAFMVRKWYVIALDGMHKLARDFPWTPEALRWRNGAGGDTRYTVYVLEAALVTPQGVTLPLTAEFCANEPATGEQPEQTEARKQDCEQKAVYRLTARLKKNFPRLHILIVADGLYANGPIVACCRRYKWDFMIVLKDGSLPVGAGFERGCRMAVCWD